MLSKQAKKAIEESQALQGKIADAVNRTVYTVQRWLDEDKTGNGMLSSAFCIDLISKETGLTREQILGINQAAA